MIFWDSSAVVPVLVTESRSPEVEGVLRADERIAAWWATPLECLAAIAQGERAGEYPPAEADGGRATLEVLRGEWTEIAPSEEVRDWASALLTRHALRATDALQLAAALTWARGRPRGHALYTYDTRLSEAARREGFVLAG